MEKIDKHIRKLLGKNEKAAKKKTMVEPIAGFADDDQSDAKAFSKELMRRQAFAPPGQAKTTPKKPLKKKKKVK